MLNLRVTKELCKELNKINPLMYKMFCKKFNNCCDNTTSNNNVVTGPVLTGQARILAANFRVEGIGTNFTILSPGQEFIFTDGSQQGYLTVDNIISDTEMDVVQYGGFSNISNLGQGITVEDYSILADETLYDISL